MNNEPTSSNPALLPVEDIAAARQVRRTKIVATLGPACEDPDTLAEMIEHGVDVVRLNFSHGSPEEHAERARLVRELAAEQGRHIGVLGDLQGPKIRIERFADKLDQRGCAEHACLDRFGADIAEADGHLVADRVEGDRVDIMHAGRVLHGDGCHGGHRITASGHDRLDVGLDAGPAAGVGAGNDQYAASLCGSIVSHAREIVSRLRL